MADTGTDIDTDRDRNRPRVEGKVLEPAPNGMWRVRLDNGHIVLAHLSEQLRLAPTRLVPGDRVAVELSPYDLTRGRIVQRLQRAI